MLIGLIILVLDIIAIADIVKSWDKAEHKLLWILVIILFPFIGMLLYFLLKKKV